MFKALLAIMVFGLIFGTFVGLPVLSIWLIYQGNYFLAFIGLSAFYLWIRKGKGTWRDHFGL